MNEAVASSQKPVASSAPLVTCLCLTKGRPEWLPKAIDCFLRQTYENRELLIVADIHEDLAGSRFWMKEDIRSILSPGVVGSKRNAGCEAASGEIIAIWDDDDYSAPGRLAGQVDRLLTTGKAVAGYTSMKFTDGQRWWQYVGGVSSLGTSLCFRRAWWQAHPFMGIQSGQDEAFADQALTQGQLVREGDLDLMYATCHFGNTSARSLANASMYRPLPGFAWREAA
jgi:glycosyltransferase involved in cell wall biosynthesis